MAVARHDSDGSGALVFLCLQVAWMPQTQNYLESYHDKVLLVEHEVTEETTAWSYRRLGGGSYAERALLNSLLLHAPWSQSIRESN